MKKKTPVEVWQKFAPLLKEFKNYYVVDDEYNQALRLRDKDEESDFFFEFGFQDNNGAYTLKMKPVSTDRIRDYSVSVNSSDLEKYLTQWLKILQYYDNVKSPFDDPFERKFREEYFSKIRIEEKDADEAPLDDEKLFRLYAYLTTVKGLLSEYKDTVPESQKPKVAEVEKECENLRSKIQSLTKNEALKGLAGLWAKTKKLSLSLAKDLLMEFFKDGIKSVASSVLEAATNPFSYIDKITIG